MPDAMTQPKPPQIGTDGYWFSKWLDEEGLQRMKRFGHGSRIPAAAAARAYKNWKIDWDRTPSMQSPGRYKIDTIDALIEQYLKFAREYYRQIDAFAPAVAGAEPSYVPTREADNMGDALDVLRELCGTMHPQEFTPGDLEKCQQAMITEKLARTTINARINRIRRFFKWLTRRGVVRGILADLQALEPVQPGRTTAREPDAKTAVHRDMVDSVFAHMPAVVQAMVEVGWFSGMRPGEIVVMRTGDIDMSGAAAGKGLWIYRPVMHKTRWRLKSRQIVLGPQAQEILRPYLKPDLSAFLFSPAAAAAERQEKKRAQRKTSVQPSQVDRAKRNPKRSPGDRYTTGSFSRAIKYACDAASKAAGLPREEWKGLQWSPNQLRHACSTRLEKKYGIDAARTVLGHSDSSTTEIYTHRDLSTASKVMGEAG